jgi:hypothetical protein
MAREATTEEDELRRLRSLAVTPEYKESKSGLFAQQVTDLSRLLEPEVRHALKEEAQHEIAKEWAEEGRAALGALADLPENWEESREFQAAMASVRADLAEHFMQDTALEPPESEIQSHSAELAQCVLANWLSLLEHAKQDAGSRDIELTAEALPKSATATKMYEGTEAFVLKQDTVKGKFSEYLATLTEAAGKSARGIVPLAPSLVLVKIDNEMHLTSSLQAAEKLVEARVPAEVSYGVS